MEEVMFKVGRMEPWGPDDKYICTTIQDVKTYFARSLGALVDCSVSLEQLANGVDYVCPEWVTPTNQRVYAKRIKVFHS